MNALDQFYFEREEPDKSCYLALRDIILAADDRLTPEWKFKLPFFYFKGKMFCYLWKDKSSQLLYAAFMEGPSLHHPLLIQGKEKRVKKIFVDPQKDIPKDAIMDVVKQQIKILITKTKK